MLRRFITPRKFFSTKSTIQGVGTFEAVPPEPSVPSTSLNKYSAVITQRKTGGAGQAQLYATQLGDIPNGMNKPQIGIGSVWFESNPCNMHLLDIGLHTKKHVEQQDMIGMRFNSIGVSDGISNGTDGMAYSLQSRDLIADSFETAIGAHFYDGVVAIPGCDKNMPGVIMALARVNRPGIMVYGGTIRAGTGTVGSKLGNKLDIISAFEAYGECYVTGEITEQERDDVVCNACPGPGKTFFFLLRPGSIHFGVVLLDGCWMVVEWLLDGPNNHAPCT